MDHRAVYDRLLSPKNERALLNLLRKDGLFAPVHVRSVVRRDHTPPYVLMTVDGKDDVIAQCMCVFIKVDELVPEHGAMRYYLPVIVVAEHIDTSSGRGAAILQHELRHLYDILDFVEHDPTYPQRVLKYAMNNASDVALLPQSIDLEVFKIFYFEPQAFALDYDNGETALEVSILGPIKVWIDCQSREEFVQHRIANYVEGFENIFIERYPAQEERIRAEFNQAVDKYGAELLGPSPYRRVKIINERLTEKIAGQRGWNTRARRDAF